VRKAVVLKGQNKAIDTVLQQFDDLHERATQELHFLVMQHGNAKERLMREGQDLEKKLADSCTYEHLMPKEYQIKNPDHYIEYDPRTGVIYAIMGREEQRNPVEIIMGMFTNRE